MGLSPSLFRVLVEEQQLLRETTAERNLIPLLLACL